jgi:hypothetical protein
MFTKQQYKYFTVVKRVYNTFVIGVPFSGEGVTICCRQFLCSRGGRDKDSRVNMMMIMSMG